MAYLELDVDTHKGDRLRYPEVLPDNLRWMAILTQISKINDLWIFFLSLLFLSNKE